MKSLARIRDSLRDGPPQVDIELSDPIPTDAEIEAEIKAQLGMVGIPEKTVKSLHSIGVHVKRQGVIQTQRGVAFVSQQWLMNALRELHRLLVARTKVEDAKEIDTEDMVKIASCIAKLGSALTESSAMMLSLEPRESGNGLPQPPPNNVFPPGAVVFGGNAQAHFHPPSGAPPEKPVVMLPPEA